MGGTGSDLYPWVEPLLVRSNIENKYLAIILFNNNFSFQAKCITEAEEKYDSLLKSLDPRLSLNYQRRCEEATKEGDLLKINYMKPEPLLF